ncbi:MAG: Txe/YoeB family addiction module toxin [Bacteroidetes bacterium]|nr:Txe/YoeB family addiction module toxin [Bacteroidota bacterium]
MRIRETEEAQEDKEKIKKSYPKSVQKKLEKLIKEMSETPYEGTGKPEALKYELTGFWSRRLTDKERIVYCVENDILYVTRYLSHYGKK